jgi:hypothetical protein
METEDSYDKVFKNIILKTTLNLKASELSNNINKTLERLLKLKVEGVCIKDGYIRPGSVTLLTRSMGYMNNASFNGNTEFVIQYKADVCNPAIGYEFQCTVSDINNSAINAYIYDVDKTPLNIFLARQHHKENPDYFKLVKDDEIIVKIIGKRFEFLDKNILVFATLHKKL